MPYTWMGHENAASSVAIVTLAIPKILAWYERRTEAEPEEPESDGEDAE